MVNAEKLFSETELIDIETSIVSAEENTSAEIVVAVATESGRYDRGECHFGVVAVFGIKSSQFGMGCVRQC